VIRQRILECGASRRAQALDLLETVVKVNSYWGNPNGVNLVGDLVLDEMPAYLKHEFSSGGDGVRHHILTCPSPGKKKILLVGHLDTVYPPESEATPFEFSDGKIVGPGTADMKGGIVVMVQALRVLDELGLLKRIPLKILLNGDEEVGSPFSSEIVRELGSGASCGLIFECGGTGNQVVVGRRGVIRFELKATGLARHAGVKEGPKASAIVELSRMILELEALNDHDRGIAINVGDTAVAGSSPSAAPVPKKKKQVSEFDESTITITTEG